MTPLPFQLQIRAAASNVPVCKSIIDYIGYSANSHFGGSQAFSGGGCAHQVRNTWFQVMKPGGVEPSCEAAPPIGSIWRRVCACILQKLVRWGDQTCTLINVTSTWYLAKGERRNNYVVRFHQPLTNATSVLTCGINDAPKSGGSRAINYHQEITACLMSSSTNAANSVPHNPVLSCNSQASSRSSKNVYEKWKLVFVNQDRTSNNET